MAIIARFDGGRLLVQESRTLETGYVGSGAPVRIGDVSTVEKIISVTTDLEKYGLICPLDEAWVGHSASVWSGQLQERHDHVMVPMRRADLPYEVTAGIGSGGFFSGNAALGLLSGITSGLTWMGELLSGVALVSGKVKVTVNVVGY
jgi:hypothetical protein